MENERDPQGRAIQDKYWGWANCDISNDYINSSVPFAILADNIEYDFNIAGAIRSGNGFGVREFFYYGKRKIDRRTCQGCYLYMSVQHIDIEHIKELKKKYTLVGLDNNCSNVQNIKNFVWPDNPLIVIGNESNGICKEVKELCDYMIEIKMRGTIRSFNCATAASIAMYDLCYKKGYL